jgi:hypothetical protein
MTFNIKLRHLLILLASSITLSGCFLSVKPIYNAQEQAKAEKAVGQFHKLHNEARYEEIYALLDENTKAELTREQFFVAAQHVTDTWGKVQSATLSEAKVFPGKPIQVRMIYNAKFEKGDGQEWFIWNMRGNEAKLLRYDPKPGFDKPDSK